MINKILVYDALKQSLIPISGRRVLHGDKFRVPDSLISLLIYDVFGGEILKTHDKKKWHFYNRIDGERLDFTGAQKNRNSEEQNFEDIPSTPDETSNYVDKTDYSTFFVDFVRAFEEAVGLENHRYGLAN